MLKTLKSKFLTVYLLLVFITALLGIVSVINVYSLSRGIQNLMTDNYKSINAASYMLEALDGQNAATLSYMNIDKNKAISDFTNYSNDFYKWYYVESYNITEPGEKDFVNKIEASHVKYLTLFSDLQSIMLQSNTDKAITFYKNEIYPQYTEQKKLLRDLSLLNEKAMFNGKENVIKASERAMYILLILSALFVLGGFIAAWLSLKKFLSPLYALRDNMKALKEGELNKHTEIVSEDEIGELSKEFNDMTKRLLQFEQSTLGKLLSEKNKSLAIVKSISDPILVMDTDYKIVLVNDSFEELFNLKEENILNKYFLEVVRNSELYDYIKNIYSTQEDEIQQKIFYFSYKNKDYYYNVLVTKLKEFDNKKYGLVVLFQNVTGLKEIERLKSNFIATVSHEFKTPLTSIMMGSSLISEETAGTLNRKQKEIMGSINEESEKLLNLVNNLLQLSKLEYSESIFKIEVYSIETIIDNSIKNFVDYAMDKNISLIYNVMNNAQKVKADIDKTTWVLNNLISNALKFTHSGGQILITAFIKQNKMCVSVKDNGEGIPNEYIEKIFEKFVQVKGTEHKGTGLGLAIAKEIVECQGGEIWCESVLGEGSTFTFTLPLDEEN
ncbi:ATP-binding protein [Candidatus Clostridium radicumherbarum]|uniref:histidine kinase n=1 Tax=Candidatus Clostridium radicumherbarum TaxID=3381662 RepID=A0ABW8TYF9_9CLOT